MKKRAGSAPSVDLEAGYMVLAVGVVPEAVLVGEERGAEGEDEAID